MYDQQGRHIAYIIAEALKTGATVEPSAEAEAEWVKIIRETMQIDKALWEGCTPGYNNNEGLEVKRYTIFGEPYGPGYNAFDALIREWLEQGELAVVLEPQKASASL